MTVHIWTSRRQFHRLDPNRLQDAREGGAEFSISIVQQRAGGSHSETVPPQLRYLFDIHQPPS